GGFFNPPDHTCLRSHLASRIPGTHCFEHFIVTCYSDHEFARALARPLYVLHEIKYHHGVHFVHRFLLGKNVATRKQYCKKKPLINPFHLKWLCSIVELEQK